MLTSEPSNPQTRDSAGSSTAGPPSSLPAVQTTSDRALIGGVARGDVGALAGVYDRYAGEMLGLALRILGDAAAAEEIVVDAFTTVWRSAERYDAERSSVPAWLMTMVRRRAIDRLRGQRSLVMDRPAAAGGALSIAGPAGDPGPAAKRSKYRTHVQRALAELSDEQRHAIELAMYEGKTHSEIATALGEPLGTVKSRIRSGMQILKTTLEPLIETTSHE